MTYYYWFIRSPTSPGAGYLAYPSYFLLPNVKAVANVRTNPTVLALCVSSSDYPCCRDVMEVMSLAFLYFFTVDISANDLNIGVVQYSEWYHLLETWQFENLRQVFLVQRDWCHFKERPVTTHKVHPTENAEPIPMLKKIVSDRQFYSPSHM